MLKSELARIAKGLFSEPIPDAPPAEFTVAPSTTDEAAGLLRFASDQRLRVLFWGAGTHQSMGHAVAPDLIVSTSRLDRIVEWQAEDLTIVVEAGVLVADLEAQLEQRGQTAVMSETPVGATVGGSIAAGISGWRRLRYGPIRDRILEVKLATGDGRVVLGGGRLVKNVTGYDLPRLATGSFGSLGLLTHVCLKLWPLAAERAMVRVDDLQRAFETAYRPYAVIESAESATVYLAGSAEEVAAQADRIGGELVSGHRWPEPLPARTELAVRAPARDVAFFTDAIRKLGVAFHAAHGVGEIRFAADGVAAEQIDQIRTAAESRGGALVVLRAPLDSPIDPWGTPPESLELQRRVKAAFDPIGIANPGRLPGRL